ncbi:hypothetical protein AAHZ94_12260 [Streptomyces sp. HSW2009]|uniref:hypothetical protein n=1 Tax=Streptomyces sp. HSW2009 TaxID=3142890 RepID=UPI0032F0692A
MSQPDQPDQPEQPERAARETERARRAVRERWRRRALTGGALLLVLALIGGGYYWFGGGYDRHQRDKLLAGACDGVLAKREARAILGDGPLEEGERGTVRKGSFAGEDRGAGQGVGERGSDDRAVREPLLLTCTVKRDLEYHAGKPTVEASVTIGVREAPVRLRTDPGYDRTGPIVPRGLAPAPLGHGWSGHFAIDRNYADGPEATTAVLLTCANSTSDLLVTAKVQQEDSTLDDPRHRAAFARVATATAKKAARHLNCDAPLGTDPVTVPLPVDEREYVPLRDADGTCAGLPPTPGTPAGKQPGIEVRHAWESARGTAPYETCVVGESGAAGSYRLRALYGPYAQDLRFVVAGQSHGGSAHSDLEERPAGQVDVPQLHFWYASARCGADRPAALYIVDALTEDSASEGRKDEPRADVAYQRRALAEFARRSAAAHGCAAPAVP